MKILIISIFLLAVQILPAFSQNESIGIFEGHGDIGKDVKPGSAVFNKQTQEYEMSGSVYNI